MAKTSNAKPSWLKGLFWVSLFATLPFLFASFSGNLQIPQNAPPSSLSENESSFANQQVKARQLFDEVMAQLQNEYVDENLNHQSIKRWKQRYGDRIETLQDAYVAIDSVIHSLNDPYTRFFRPEDFAEQSLAISSRLFGVGVEIAMLNDAVTVMNVLPNSPAAQEGSLEIGDTITHINQKPVEGLSLMQVARQIRGEKGSPVTLKVRAMGESGEAKKASATANLKTVKLVRDEIKIEHVAQVALKKHPQVGYIKLQSFMGQAVALQFAKALDAVDEKPYLVIDLRNNAGGMLSNAVEIADMFLGRVKIVEVEGRGNKYDTMIMGEPPVDYVGKVALLLNGGSASASEVLAGALRDYDRAILVGEDSYGKGMVQQIVPLPRFETGLNLTIAHYLTPKGQNLNHVGLKPDVVVPRDEARKAVQSGKDLVLERAIEALQTKNP